MKHLAPIDIIVEKAKHAGARHAEVWCETTEILKIKVSRGIVESSVSAIEKGTALRVIVNDRVGISFISGRDDESVKTLVNDALESARHSDAEKGLNFAEQTETVRKSDLQIYDASAEEKDFADKTELAKRWEEEARIYDPAVNSVDYSQYSEAIRETEIMNSNGLYDTQKSSSFAGTFMCTAHREGHGTKEASHFSCRRFGELASQNLGSDTAEKCLNYLGGRAVSSCMVPVIFTSECTASIIAGFSGAFIGENGRMGRSMFIGKLGKAVGSPRINLVDDGLFPGKTGSRYFDGEGVKPQKTVLIRKGVLKNFLYDRNSGIKQNVKSTGNCIRNSYRGIPGPGITNLMLSPGESSIKSMIKKVSNGFYVTSITNTGGINPSTGACSLGAAGRWIKNGKLSFPVDAVTLSTSFNDFLHGISDLGGTIRWFGIVGAPPVLLDACIVGGSASK